MFNPHVLLTVRTVRLITLLILNRQQTTARGAIFLLFAYRLSSQLIILMLVKTLPSPECSIARISRNSNMRKRAWRNRRTIDARLFAFMCHFPTTYFITLFTHVPCCHRTCNIYNHMVMPGDFFIKKVNSFFGLNLSIKHYVFTI